VKKTKKTAVSAILTALSVILLLIGNLTQVLDLTAVVIASLAVVLAVIEIGNPYPWLVYAATGILALLILPDKVIALEYLLFGGIYPIFKAMFERYHYAVAWTLKMSLFNTGFILLIVIANYIMHIPDSGYDFNIPLLLLGNLFFVIYDLALTRIITLYIVRVRKKLKLKDIF
jgi:hypothetical protein